MRTLKYFRIVLAVLFAAAITFLFLDVSENGSSPFRFDSLTRIQFIPALLSLNIVALLILVGLTLVLGRIYCSVICPLGVYQDFIAWLRKRFSPKRKLKVGLFRYKPARSLTRNIIFGAFVIVILLGLLNVMAISLGAIIEPYSAFGRLVTAFLSPLYDAGNNYLAEQAAQAGTYEYLPVSRAVSATLLAIATVTFLVVSVMAWRGGRDYCNTICPVGTLLGFMSRFSWLKIRIDNDRCNGCGTCQRHCKASCIDSKNHYIDYSRCVDCFDCIGTCRQNALQFRPIRKGEKVVVAKHSTIHKDDKKHNEAEEKAEPQADKSKRVFIATLGVLTGAAVAKGAEKVVEKVTDGGLTPLKDRKEPVRQTRIVPPGSISQVHINAHCVGCQLCVQACPHGLLSMSTSLGTLMQPVISYAHGYCPPECTRCSNVCPAGVFKPLDVALKSSWKVGTAVVDASTCLSATGEAQCGNCARHCPAGAIDMVPMQKSGATHNPVVDYEKCVGCGACVGACNFQALTMDGEHPVLNAANCVGCGSCADACGADAIVMSDVASVAALPVVNADACIGCGSCEYHCPVGTVATMEADTAAIHVEGVSPQRKI